jgi:hypothetical protein
MISLLSGKWISGNDTRAGWEVRGLLRRTIIICFWATLAGGVTGLLP